MINTSSEITPTSIQILSDEVIDQIAAGEVVERPAHLVKELVENSLDARASQISVEFFEGGRRVKVSDNGSGIPEAQLKSALDRHATSKIKISSDLWKLQSFGFRGEALASIAAVSEMTLISKTAQQKSAARVRSLFGERSEVEMIGGSEGTSIQIEKLFENVPARLKFMKSAAAESSRIKLCLKALALSHPTVEFKISQDYQLLSFWPAVKTRLERAQQVLQIEELFIGEATRGQVTAYSIFASPENVQKTAKEIWFFAQNRWIQDRSLQAAVMEAYRHLLMHGEFPVVLSWLETPPEEIDVNIHPTKSQVKFAEPSMAFRAVQASVRDVLEKAPWLPAASNISSNPSMAIPNKQIFATGNVQNSVEQFSLQFKTEDLGGTQFPQKSWTVREPIRTQSPAPQENSAISSGYWSSLQVLSQTNLTYLLTQNSEGLVIVDQHAAHERVIFEKLMAAWKGGQIEIQEFLFPLAVDLSQEKVEALTKEKEIFLKLGISMEALGPETIGIHSAPSLLKESALHQVLEKMAQELVDQGGSHRLERKIGDLLATMACHSAVRAGQALSVEEMKALLIQMDQYPLSSFCPHGRPVSVNYPFYQLEKDFGRTV